MTRGPRHAPRRTVVLVVVLAASALGYGWATAASSGEVTAASSPKFVTHNCFDSKMTPEKIVFTCADFGEQARELNWGSWGGSPARARGKLRYNTCDPSCANGDIRRTRIKLRLRRARPCSNEGGDEHYRKAIFRFTEGVPNGYSRSERRELFCPID